MRLMRLFVCAVVTAALCGCSVVSPYHSVRDIVRVTNAQIKQQPTRLNGASVSGADRMVLIRDAASWQAYWGEGEAPPAVDFGKEIVLVVSSWMASGGPGSVEIRIVGYSDDNKTKTRTVLVQDSVSGSWDTPGGVSRAYDIAAIPVSDNKIVLKWQRNAGKGVKETLEEPVPFSAEDSGAAAEPAAPGG
jgi:hypothetical protein